jgi:Icc-related predicted phosphoesterase
VEDVGPMVAPIKVAAAGDLHASPAHRDQLFESFTRVEDEADLVLLAGDLTAHGTVEEAEVLADACRDLRLPVFAVLGNHDHHAGRADDVTQALHAGGIVVLDRSYAICETDGIEIGIVGTKGFVGGFPGSLLPDFGEPLLRQVYSQTTEEVAAIERGLQEVSHCALRIVLLHYAPIIETLEGEPPGIHAFLGSMRLGTPIAEYSPDLVVHGHAHAGSFEGAIGRTPVYNVAVHVTGRDFFVFDLTVEKRGAASVEVEDSEAQVRSDA